MVDKDSKKDSKVFMDVKPQHKCKGAADILMKFFYLLFFVFFFILTAKEKKRKEKNKRITFHIRTPTG